MGAGGNGGDGGGEGGAIQVDLIVLHEDTVTL